MRGRKVVWRDWILKNQGIRSIKVRLRSTLKEGILAFGKLKSLKLAAVVVDFVIRFIFHVLRI